MLDQQFDAKRPNESWVSDITYIWTAEAKSTIVDYICGYYQIVRPHRFNGYLPPAKKEKRYFNKNLLSGVLN